MSQAPRRLRIDSAVIDRPLRQIHLSLPERAFNLVPYVGQLVQRGHPSEGCERCFCPPPKGGEAPESVHVSRSLSTLRPSDTPSARGENTDSRPNRRLGLDNAIVAFNDITKIWRVHPRMDARHSAPTTASTQVGEVPATAVIKFAVTIRGDCA